MASRLLIERDADLAAVRDLLVRAVGGQGLTALVEGPPGIGKTALLAATAEHAAELGMQVVTAIGGELEQDMPFAIVRQLFERPLRARPGLLTGAAGIAAPVFGQQDGTTALGDVVHGLYWLCAGLAEDGPLLVIVDDVHWADESSLRFLSHLSRRIADLPAVLLLAGRPGAMLDRLVDGVLVRPQAIRLGPLSEQGVGVLVRAELSADADAEFCRACTIATGGNPFLLAEALTRLRADGTRPVAAEAHRVEQLRPDTITRAVLARIARLGPDAVRFARSLAILGPGAQPRHLAALSGLSIGDTIALADGLAREAIVTADRPIGFVHPLVRTVVYADSTGLLRAEQHKQAARILAADGVAAEEYAQHLLACEPAADPWVVDSLRTAAANAVGRGAPESAVSYLTRATAEPPLHLLRGAVTAELGRALTMSNRLSEAAVALREAIGLTGPLLDRLQLSFELGFIATQAGWAAEAAETAALTRAMIAELDTDLPLPMHAALALTDIVSFQPPEVWMSRVEKVAAQLTGTDEADRVILSLLSFGAAGLGDRPAAEAAELAERAAAGPLPSRDSWILLNMASAALAVTDRLPEALDLLDRGLAGARALGHEWEFRYLAMLRSHTAWYAGRLAEAEGDSRTALEDPRNQDAPLAAATLIDILVERGRYEEAERVIADYDLGGDVHGGMLIMHFVPVARGRLRLRRNEFAGALADFLTAGKIVLTAGFANPGFAEWRAGAVQAYLGLSQRGAAADMAAENLRLARSFGAPRSIALALRMMALVQRECELELLAEAVSLLDGSPAELEHAYCLIAYGSALRRAGHRTRSLDPLRRGLDLATRCGAEPLATTAIQELHAAGARPRRAAVTGRDALTASELRVAHHAADGLTNREIAQTLFLSTRTVEVHLTNTYRKLGIDTRQKLKQAIADS
ncbi:AAA family ATPase [Actinocrispum sp. NPDC049592]|uniref:helix-turn-helix transcriptional regulator n=1 Tax=Actinocrispum sp. NPDC049592 TaxID=3154835 RepID=UPI00343086E3